MIHIPYEVIQGLFGTYVADHFNDIVIGIMGIGALIYIIASNVGRREKEKDWLTEAQQRQQNKYAYSDPQYSRYKNKITKAPKEKYDKAGGKWSATGWYFNPDTELWEPPKRMSRRSKKKR